VWPLRGEKPFLNNAATSVSRQTVATSLSTLEGESSSIKQEKKPRDAETGDEFLLYPALLIIYCMSHWAQTLHPIATYDKIRQNLHRNSYINSSV